MYCRECGEEIDSESQFCPSCGASLGEGSGKPDGSNGVDFDFIQSIQDGFDRTKLARALIDAIILLSSVGLWLGVMAAEYINHHSKLNKGERDPYEEGDDKVWHLF